MDAATRRGVRPAHLAVGAIVAAACVAVAVGVLILTGGGGAAVSPLPAPTRVALVYAMPVGKRFVAHRELVYAASPTAAHPIRLAVGTFPMLSPDGRVVAYVGGSLDHPTGLRLIGSLGGASRPVGIAGLQPTLWAWSWNSRLLAVSDAHGLVVVDARSLRSTPIRLPEASFNFSFSPDGSMLAYEHSTGSGNDIYTVAVSSGAIHRFTDDGSSFPLWGPRGIAFERFTGRCCHGDVWLMNASGGDARRLTHTHAGIHPAAWSADGSRMVAAYPATNNGKLYAVDVLTGRPRALTRSSATWVRTASRGTAARCSPRSAAASSRHPTVSSRRSRSRAERRRPSSAARAVRARTSSRRPPLARRQARWRGRPAVA